MKTTKRIFTTMLTMALSVSMLAGCGEKKDDGVTEFSIGNFPTSSNPDYERSMKKVEEFNASNPEYRMIPDEYTYSTQDFIAKAAGGTLPTAWSSYFTEIKLIAGNGYCADLSEYMKECGLLDAYNPEILEVVKGENGEIWGLPYMAYAQGLTINKQLFNEAGLVNDDGTIKYPQTWEEVADFAKQIKDKTGQAGFLMPTTDNCGGWHFMNIAWAYGTEFMKQDADGKWKATFDSKEFRAACDWLYDLRWNKDAIYTNKTAISNADKEQIFGAYQAGMMIANAPYPSLTQSYDMKIEDIACCRIPSGPKGRVAQSGGGVIFVRSDATPEQIRGVLKWYMNGSWNTKVDDETLKNSEDYLSKQVDLKNIILEVPEAFPKFINYEGREKELELYKKYCNVDMNDYNDYLSFEDVEVRPEEPVACQQLYAVLDGIVQEILTNKNVDLDSLIKAAVNDFQSNHLDNQ